MTKAVEQVYMTPAALQEAAIELWGADKWRGAFSEHTGISYSQLHRYMTVYKGQRIPQTLAMVMHLLMTLKVNDIELTPLPMFPVTDLKPIKFEWVKKPKPERPNNDAPEEDFFSTDDPEPETPAPEPEKAADPAPEPEKVETKPNRKRAALVPEAGPVKGRAGTPAKATTAKPAKAKTPAKKTAKA